eukprot:1102748_1
MDESMFLQYCARFRAVYNIAWASILDLEGTRTRCLTILPSTLSPDEARVKGPNDFDIPSAHAGEVSWNGNTAARFLCKIWSDPELAPFESYLNRTNESFEAPIPGLPSYDSDKIIASKELKISGQFSLYRGIRIRKNGTKDNVVIKVFHRASDWDECKCRIDMLLHISGHPNVMSVLSFFETPEPAIIMNFIVGGDLR